MGVFYISGYFILRSLSLTVNTLAENWTDLFKKETRIDQDHIYRTLYL